MKITLLAIGKTEESYLKEGISIFENRLHHYLPFESIIIPALKNAKNLSTHQQKIKEGELILKNIVSTDRLVVLDELGKQHTSVEFANYIQKNTLMATKNLMFVVGGPFGFSNEVYKRANDKISLSKMTFSHQMVRLFFVEQLYRAMTIIKGEQYHHGN